MIVFTQPHPQVSSGYQVHREGLRDKVKYRVYANRLQAKILRFFYFLVKVVTYSIKIHYEKS